MNAPKGWRQLGDVIARHGMERRHLLRALQRLPGFNLSPQEVSAILKHVQYHGGPSERFVYGSRSSRCWEALEADLESITRLPPQIPQHNLPQSSTQPTFTSSRVSEVEHGEVPALISQDEGKP